MTYKVMKLLYLKEIETISDLCSQVDGLEEYLNDPVKQHYLIRTLPAKVKRQLLFKR